MDFEEVKQEPTDSEELGDGESNHHRVTNSRTVSLVSLIVNAGDFQSSKSWSLVCVDGLRL